MGMKSSVMEVRRSGEGVRERGGVGGDMLRDANGCCLFPLFVCFSMRIDVWLVAVRVCYLVDRMSMLCFSLLPSDRLIGCFVRKQISQIDTWQVRRAYSPTLS